MKLININIALVKVTECNGESRRSDNGGRGGGKGGWSQKLFSALRASAWSKMMGGPGPPAPFPGSATGMVQELM